MAKQRAYRRRNDTVPLILTGGLIVLFLIITVAASLFLVSWVRGMGKGGTGGGGSSNPFNPGNPPSENVEYKFGQPLPVWTGTQRVTVLLLGIDERSQETGPFRTDTMMLVTLDPVTLQAGALSIPRDLWVPIPGYNDGRINTAHFLGDLYKYPGGGPALAKATVEYNLGVPVDYYVRINFQGFVKLVDLIGGVDVYVEKVIDDPTYPDYNYGYDPLHIEPGWHHFDGEMALKYARTRHGSSDFDRARRQQQVLTAILERITSLDLLPQLAKNAPEILNTLQNSVQTDLATDQIMALAALAVKVDRQTIHFGVIDQTCTQPWVTPEGAQVLVPLRDRMREVRDYVFSSGTSATPGATEAPTPTPETASVVVLNGTPRSGLAVGVSQYLQAQGITIAGYNNADRQDYATSMIILYKDKPATGNRLVTLLKLSESAIVRGNDPNVAYDVVVVLGSDYQGPTQP